MDLITIPSMNERAYSALAERFGDPSAKLHGVLAPCPQPGMVQVLWPYREVLAALGVNDRSRRDDVFYKGISFLDEFLSIYLRSLQLLGISASRLEQKLEDDFREAEAHRRRGEKSWPVEIDLEAPFGYFHTSYDVCIHLDSCISYLKIIADGVAKTLSSVFGSPPFSVSRESMNNLWNNALKQTGSPLERVFRSRSRAWLNTLSSARGEVAGIRDARIHHGAWFVPIGSEVGHGQYRITILQSSIGKEGPGYRPGETIRDLVDHSRDVVSDLVASTAGFFSFLDDVVRMAAEQNPALNPVRKNYSKLGYREVFGPSDFLSSVLPAV
jgi:hypothetical protein